MSQREKSALFGDNHDQSTNHFSNVHKIFSSYLNRGGTLQTSFHETSSVSYDDNLETYNANNILEVKVTWKEVTNYIDKIGFIFFLMVMLCNYVVFALKTIYRL